MSATTVRYHVLHETRYAYASPASLSRQQLHLSPRVLAWQQIELQSIEILPVPSWRRDGVDPFGNPVSWVAFDQAHASLCIRSALTLTLQPRQAPALAASPAWESVRDRLAYRGLPPDADDLEACQFLFESPHVRVKHELADFAAPCFPPGRPLLQAVAALMERIFSEFVFDPQATTVSTPILEVLEKKRGVCQDFAHLMIGCLRALGLAARYVSGYLLTRPPPGRPRETVPRAPQEPQRTLQVAQTSREEKPVRQAQVSGLEPRTSPATPSGGERDALRAAIAAARSAPSSSHAAQGGAPENAPARSPLEMLRGRRVHHVRQTPPDARNPHREAIKAPPSRQMGDNGAHERSGEISHDDLLRALERRHP